MNRSHIGIAFAAFLLSTIAESGFIADFYAQAAKLDNDNTAMYDLWYSFPVVVLVGGLLTRYAISARTLSIVGMGVFAISTVGQLVYTQVAGLAPTEASLTLWLSLYIFSVASTTVGLYGIAVQAAGSQSLRSIPLAIAAAYLVFTVGNAVFNLFLVVYPPHEQVGFEAATNLLNVWPFLGIPALILIVLYRPGKQFFEAVHSSYSEAMDGLALDAHMLTDRDAAVNAAGISSFHLGRLLFACMLAVVPGVVLAEFANNLRATSYVYELNEQIYLPTMVLIPVLILISRMRIPAKAPAYALIAAGIAFAVAAAGKLLGQEVLEPMLLPANMAREAGMVLCQIAAFSLAAAAAPRKQAILPLAICLAVNSAGWRLHELNLLAPIMNEVLVMVFGVVLAGMAAVLKNVGSPLVFAGGVNANNPYIETQTTIGQTANQQTITEIMSMRSTNLSNADRETQVAAVQELRARGVEEPAIRAALTQEGISDMAIEDLLSSTRPLQPRATPLGETASEPSGYVPPPAQSSGGGVPKILIYVGILVLVNILSWLFDWGFIIY